LYLNRKPTPLKKRKSVGGGTSKIQPTSGKGSGTSTGHYFNFVKRVLDQLDKHEQFKDYYLVMDNVPIHKNNDVRKLIEGRGYGCVYLPSYSPEVNPIEQLWSVCKSKLKREALLEEETLTLRIRGACNQILFSDLAGFCRYSTQRFDDCLNRRPL
jgi:transposase